MAEAITAGSFLLILRSAAYLLGVIENFKFHVTTTQIWAALATVAALLGWSNALFKNVFGKNLGEAIRGAVMKRMFNSAIFRKDVLTKLEALQLQVNQITKEVRYNGGSVTTVEAIKRLEHGQKQIFEAVTHLRGLRDISDKFDSVMKFKYDPEQGVTFINEEFLNTFGVKEDQVLWYGYTDLLHPDDVPEMWAKWQKAIETMTPFRDVQRIRDMTGHYHKCEVKAVPILVNGQIKEFSGMISMSYH